MASEAEDILDLYDDGPHDAAVLCTLVELSGSGYRRPGARLIVVRDAAGIVRRAGMISGGCLEGDLCRRAFGLAATGPKVVAYDTREDAPVPAGFNTGCEGVVHVLVEQATAAKLNETRHSIESNKASPEALIYHGSDIGRRYTAADAPAWLELDEPDEPISRVIADRRVLIDPHHPPRPLIVVGDGDDARPLVDLAAAAGFRVWLCGRRSALATAERFPRANRVLCGGVDDLLIRLPLTPRSAAVLVMHDLAEDAAWLPPLLASTCGHVALLGPKRRVARVMADLHERGSLPETTSLKKLHAPAGLDLGGDGPQAVALSVLAGVQASLHERDSRPLRDGSGPIHAAHREVEA